jgi:hypothetical protein
MIIQCCVAFRLILKAIYESSSFLVGILIEFVLAEEEGSVEVIEAFVVALAFLLIHLCPVIPEAHLIAENGEIDCMLHLLEIFNVVDVVLRVEAIGSLLGYCRVRIFIHY